MAYEALLSLLDGIASDFLFLDGPEIDIPAAGKFMNQLDSIALEAEKSKMGPVKEVASALSGVMEKIVLNSVEDKTFSFAIVGDGVSIMQAIVDKYVNTGNYDGVAGDYLKKIAYLAGTTSRDDDAEKAMLTATRVEDAVADEINEASHIEEGSEKSCKPEETMAKIQDGALLRDFIAEGLEYIEEIEVNILNLEKNPEDREYVNAIFRSFHSIKGVAGFLSLDQIREFAHNLENLLDKARNGQLAVTPSLIDVVLDGSDTLKTMIGQLKSKLEGKEEEAFNLDLPSFMERISLVENAVNAPPRTKKIGEILLEDGHISKNVLEEGLKIVQASPGKKLGEALITEGKVTPKQVSQALRKQADQVTDMANIRVDTRKLDDLIDMVGELVITQSMIQQDIKNQSHADRTLVRDVSQFFRITSGLQRTATSLRMVPIKQTFQRMSRLVRDLARTAGKMIEVEMMGEETEIDRNMVDEIYNPLVHMIRNSVDHGIEAPEERVKAGKQEGGAIRLKAYHRGGKIIIEVADDGRGLDKEKILQKAARNGIIQNGEALAEQDVFRLIFHPGLSTAEKITDISGRGVGMDVVKQAVEKLRGKIEIESICGKGTAFMASFPLTLAIIDGMIVKVGPESYILPTTAIRQAVRPLKTACNNVIGRGEMVSVMGQLLPLVRLHSLFGIEPEHENPWDAIVVVVNGENRSKCFLVDRIIGKTEVVIKNLGDGLGKIKGVAGGAILGDGRIGLILDTEGIFELSEISGEKRFVA